MAELVLELQLTCSSDGSLTQQTLTFDHVPDSVKDLKQKIEDELSIPKSGQNLFLPDGQVLVDSEPVVNLYLRSGDTLKVTFFNRADVKQLRNTINQCLRPVLTLLRTNSSIHDAKLIQKRQDSKALLTSCQSSLHELSFKSLLPWNNHRTEANRRYLLQEGALPIILELYTILLPLPWDWRGNLLQDVEICCLSFLWNFSETAYARQLIVDKGGFEMMLKSLMHQSDDEFLKKYTMHDIFDAAVGCISNYCELKCCQLPMAKNTLALQRLLHFALYGPSLNSFTKMLIANLFFRLSHCRDAHQYLVVNSILEQLVRFSDNQDITIRYVLGLTYARLVLYSQDSIGQEYLQQMCDRMKYFLLQVKPSVVSQLEERHQYNWITILPFLEAAYMYGVETVKLTDACLKKTQPSATFSEVKEASFLLAVNTKSLATTLSLAYILLALKIETVRSINIELLVKQGLLEYVTMLHWGLDNGWHNQCLWVQQQVSKINKLSVPRLSSIAKGRLARFHRQYSGQIKSYADQLMKLCFTLFAVIMLATMFTVAEGISELLNLEKKLVCHQLDLFTHGGMVFLFTTSVIFATVYLLIYMMYFFGLSKRWNFPSKKSFYRYALVLSVINILQALGSMLWYTGKDRRIRGSSGICITTVTTFIYLTTFAPVVYWIFLKNYFRMNEPSRMTSRSGTKSINTSSEEAHTPTKRRSISVRFSKPTLMGKRSSYFEEQTMLEGDLDSSVSSYGSFTNSEEIFSRLDK